MSGESLTGERKDYVEIAIRYASDVVLGHQPASRLTRLSCQRFLDDLKRADKGEWAYVLDTEKAFHVCRFVEMFPHVKGARGRLELLGWQVFVLVNLFGWLDELGVRRFRTGYIEMPKKQGKTTFVAPLGLYSLCMDDEEGAEVYCAAVDRGQARILWSIAKQMALRTPVFLKRYGIECGANAISHAPSGSTYQALSREGKSLEGKNPSMALVDELHRHQTREVWDILDESRGARMQPLMIAITNTGSDKSSICYEQRSYLVKVLNGYQDDSYFGVIYTIDEQDEKNWDSPEVWRKAQPSLGYSTSIESLERLARKARLMPSARSSFMRYQLGVWTEGEHGWLRGEKWKPCANPLLTEESLRGRQCYVGVDLASKVDVAAMVAVFRTDAGKYQVLWKFYIPESRIKDNDQYYGWSQKGWVIPTPGSTIDFAMIEEDLRKWHEIFNILGVPYDPWQATQFATNLKEHRVPMIEFRQNAQNFSEPMKEIERLVVMEDSDGNHTPQFEHAGSDQGDDPLSWMISNVVVKPDRNENIFPNKEREENKIDGAVAMIMATGMWVSRPLPKRSKYADGASLAAVG